MVCPKIYFDYLQIKGDSSLQRTQTPVMQSSAAQTPCIGGLPGLRRVGLMDGFDCRDSLQRLKSSRKEQRRVNSKVKEERFTKDCQRNLDHELAASRIAFFFAKIHQERDAGAIRMPTLEAVKSPIDKLHFDDELSVASTPSSR